MCPTMATTSPSEFKFSEEDVIRMILEFLSNRDLSISQLSLERETGVVNGLFSDDLLFLRQLILDGQWDDALEFVEPLMTMENFNAKQVKYLINKNKYVELLCIRAEASPLQNVEVAVTEIVDVLNKLEECCPSKEDYNELCLLLTLPSLHQHKEFKNWNPSHSRISCFHDLLPLIEKYLPVEKKDGISSSSLTTLQLRSAKGDRLFQLIIKGILYESCVDYCQQRATKSDSAELNFTSLLHGTGFSSADLSLLSWLQSIPPETFSYPFEQKVLNVDVEQIEKPSLVASWSEVILATPIKPRVFPHSATPFTKIKATDLMSKSLTPGLVDKLSQSFMDFSVANVAEMSRSSMAATGFHLQSSNSSGKKLPQTGVDKIFEEGDVFNSSCIGALPTITEKSSPSSTKSPETPLKAFEETLPLKSPLVKVVPKVEVMRDSHVSSSANVSESLNSPDLWKAFQAKKKELMDRLNEDDTLDVDGLLQSSTNISCSGNLAGNKSNRVAFSSGSSPASNQNHSLQLRNQVEPHYRHHQSHHHSMIKVDNNNSRFVTPERQTGIRHYPDRDNLATTSTPKGQQRIQQYHQQQQQQQQHQVQHLQNQTETGQRPSPIYPPVDKAAMALNYSSHTGSTPLSHGPSYTKRSHSQSESSSSANSHTSNTNNNSNCNNINHNNNNSSQGNGKKAPQFVPVTRLEDAQAIRAAEFHPSGRLYGIGSNSKTLRICGYPRSSELKSLSEDHEAHQPSVLFKRMKHHKGSIYCLAWNPSGDLLATGSNDKTIKLMQFNEDSCDVDGAEAELTMHDGTIRDMCFMEDLTNGSNLLISGGAGDCKIYVTDCQTATPFQALSGHSGHILSLYTWGGAVFVSGSQDRTMRFWDLRTRGCVNLITAPPTASSGPGSAVGAVCVDPSGRLLVSGHEDSTCMLYDIRGGRVIQTFRPHTAEIRTLRFSPKAYYLLSGGYDNKIALTDLQGDLTQPLSSVVVAEHTDKVIQGRWHPNDFVFLSTSADKTATLWALPN